MRLHLLFCHVYNTVGHSFFTLLSHILTTTFPTFEILFSMKQDVKVSVVPMLKARYTQNKHELRECGCYKSGLGPVFQLPFGTYNR